MCVVVSYYSLVPRLPAYMRKEGESGVQSHVTNIAMTSLKTTVDVKSVCQLQFIKHCSLRPSRILVHSLEGFGTISYIHVKLEHLT